MFRNPRENRTVPPNSRVTPSVGRPPSPPHHDSNSRMAAKSALKATPHTAHQQKVQSTLVPGNGNKRSPANNAWKGKPKATPNGNIMAFFKKAEEQNSTLFLRERGAASALNDADVDEEGVGWNDGIDGVSVDAATGDSSERYNESGGSNKKRKVSEDIATIACSPPPPEAADAPMPKVASLEVASLAGGKVPKKTGPFIDDSDSEGDDVDVPVLSRGMNTTRQLSTTSATESKSPEKSFPVDSTERTTPTRTHPPLLKMESTSVAGDVDFDEFEGLEDEDFPEGEEYDERRWMEEQRRLEKAQAEFEETNDDVDLRPMFPDDEAGSFEVKQEDVNSPICPICSANLEGIGDQEVSVHVNACLDGRPIPLPKTPDKATTVIKEGTPTAVNGPRMFKKPVRPARSGQENPFALGEAAAQPKSAFSKLMAGHAEDAAWASAASSETAARGKPSYERTCPFYKIMPGFYICVDAFRYGAVKGQNAYFLSHFHSDHYIGLTKSWSHGPIYCSRVTANLVRQQLRVDPKWVVDLEFEKKTEVPGTEGVFVTMISANHCPGSSLFLFEKEVGKGKSSKLQRVLHCGDFRACQAHIEHPLLRPEVIDAVSGASKQQKLDACYLDTTYLTPKYAFPPQQQVIQACADMCVSLNKERADETDAWEQVKRNRAGKGMVKFVRKESEPGDDKPVDNDEEDVDAMKITKSGSTNRRGRLLVVVGTYSIGKERICMGIAKALGSKIYAPPNKQRICRALEDPELDALLTDDPRAAQVHMTPLFEIRAETLDDYLRDYRDCFSRTVGFRPSGWNYRPPKSRFTESPSVQTVLLSHNWKSDFTMQDLNPQPGSTRRASCFGVPYSEHSSFRELTMFCCALRIDKIIPTVNVGSAKSREKMKAWCERWALDKKKNGLFRLGESGCTW